MSIEEAKMQGQIHDWSMADVNHMPVPGAHIPRTKGVPSKDELEQIRDKILADEAKKEAEKTPEQKAQESEEAKQKLVTARVKMLFNQPFFGNIACRLKLKDVTDEQWCPTAATDGRYFF